MHLTPSLISTKIYVIHSALRIKSSQLTLTQTMIPTPKAAHVLGVLFRNSPGDPPCYNDNEALPTISMHHPHPKPSLSNPTFDGNETSLGHFMCVEE